MEIREASSVNPIDHAEQMAYAEDFHRVLAMGYREAGFENFAKEEENLAEKIGEQVGAELKGEEVQKIEKESSDEVVEESVDESVQEVKAFIEDEFFAFLHCKSEQESFFFENFEDGRNIEEVLEILKSILVPKDSEDFNQPIPSEEEAGVVRFYSTRFSGVAIALRRFNNDKGWMLGLLKRRAK
jgi:hypothetical protein